jgi:hypothetical protein
VCYRSVKPSKETVVKVQRELQENNIDESQLVKSRIDNCQ